MKQCPRCLDLFKDEAAECPKCHCELENGDESYAAEITGNSTPATRIHTYFSNTAFDKVLCVANASAAVLFALGMIFKGEMYKALIITAFANAVSALLIFFRGYIYEGLNRFADAGIYDVLGTDTHSRVRRLKSGRTNHIYESTVFTRKIRILCVCTAVCFLPTALMFCFFG